MQQSPNLAFYATVAQIIPILFVTLAGELGLRPLLTSTARESEAIAERLRQHSMGDRPSGVFERALLGTHARQAARAGAALVVVAVSLTIVMLVCEGICLEVLGDGDPAPWKGILVAVGLGVTAVGVGVGVAALAISGYRRSVAGQMQHDDVMRARQARS